MNLYLNTSPTSFASNLLLSGEVFIFPLDIFDIFSKIKSPYLGHHINLARILRYSREEMK